jgi:hypothetical protein
MVCLKGSREHRLLFVREGSGGDALLMTATVYVGVSDCAASEDIIIGVRLD